MLSLGYHPKSKQSIEACGSKWMKLVFVYVFFLPNIAAMCSLSTNTFPSFQPVRKPEPRIGEASEFNFNKFFIQFLFSTREVSLVEN